MDIKTYKKDADYSYTLGAFPTFELIDAQPDKVIEVLVHSSFTDRDKLESVCAKKGITVTQNDKLISKLSDKENVYVIGVFKKYSQDLDASKPHAVFVNPGNMGNLGTIIRTACGFGIDDIAVIEPAADAFNPKTVRASMGSLFRIRLHSFASYEDYMKQFDCDPRTDEHERKVFTFMLNGTRPLTVADCPKPELFSLVFGNEATGLPNEFLNYGTSIIIPQTEHVDSLNLTIAAGIGMYMFTAR